VPQPDPEWVPLPDAPGYFVSEDGNVLGKRGRVLKPGLDSYGYQQVNICGDGKKTTTGVHRCVALAFIGPKPSALHEVAHNDGDRQNNHRSNIRWATHRENMEDRTRHSTGWSGWKMFEWASGGQNATA